MDAPPADARGIHGSFATRSVAGLLPRLIGLALALIGLLLVILAVTQDI